MSYGTHESNSKAKRLESKGRANINTKWVRPETPNQIVLSLPRDKSVTRRERKGKESGETGLPCLLLPVTESTRRMPTDKRSTQYVSNLPPYGNQLTSAGYCSSAFSVHTLGYNTPPLIFSSIPPYTSCNKKQTKKRQNKTKIVIKTERMLHTYGADLFRFYSVEHVRAVYHTPYFVHVNMITVR